MVGRPSPSFGWDRSRRRVDRATPAHLAALFRSASVSVADRLASDTTRRATSTAAVGLPSTTLMSLAHASAPLVCAMSALAVGSYFLHTHSATFSTSLSGHGGLNWF